MLLFLLQLMELRAEQQKRNTEKRHLEERDLLQQSPINWSHTLHWKTFIIIINISGTNLNKENLLFIVYWFYLWCVHSQNDSLLNGNHRTGVLQIKLHLSTTKENSTKTKLFKWRFLRVFLNTHMLRILMCDEFKCNNLIFEFQ